MLMSVERSSSGSVKGHSKLFFMLPISLFSTAIYRLHCTTSEMLFACAWAVLVFARSHLLSGDAQLCLLWKQAGESAHLELPRQRQGPLTIWGRQASKKEFHIHTELSVFQIWSPCIKGKKRLFLIKWRSVLFLLCVSHIDRGGEINNNTIVSKNFTSLGKLALAILDCCIGRERERERERERKRERKRERETERERER